MRPDRRRRGVAMVAVLACLTLLAMVFFTLMRQGSAGKRQARAEEDRLMAGWLAESALDRAWARLRLAADYPGETWDVPAEEIGGRDAGRVVIAVQAVPGQPSNRLVTARADFPLDATRRARQSRSATFHVDSSPPGGPR